MLSNISKSLLRVTFVIGLATILTSCATVHSTRLAYRCHTKLETAHEELERAKAKGFSQSVSWTKAASLITSAKIQQQYEKYPTCINNSARALYYISRSSQI